MNILAVDDEHIMLSELISELEKVFPEQKICGHMLPSEALRWAATLAQEGQTLDYAFLDIQLRGMTGLELARQLKQMHPKAVLIFCTAHTQYAFEAMGLFAKGYLCKPVVAEDIIRTLDEMVYDWRKSLNPHKKEIRVQTFGHFCIFVDEKPLTFEREKAKELLAYLVDRHGAPITTEQIASVLWEDRPYNRTLKNYVSTVLASLKNTLRAAGAEDILIKSRNHLAIDTEKIQCDAYAYEKGDLSAVNSFRGEYMVNYSWAEFTTGRYITMAGRD